MKKYANTIANSMASLMKSAEHEDLFGRHVSHSEENEVDPDHEHDEYCAIIGCNGEKDNDDPAPEEKVHRSYKSYLDDSDANDALDHEVDEWKEFDHYDRFSDAQKAAYDKITQMCARAYKMAGMKEESPGALRIVNQALKLMRDNKIFHSDAIELSRSLGQDIDTTDPEYMYDFGGDDPYNAPYDPNPIDYDRMDSKDIKDCAAYNIAIESLLTASAALDAANMSDGSTLSLKLASFVSEAKKAKTDKMSADDKAKMRAKEKAAKDKERAKAQAAKDKAKAQAEKEKAKAKGEKDKQDAKDAKSKKDVDMAAKMKAMRAKK
jgi:hypothetical protein